MTITLPENRFIRFSDFQESSWYRIRSITFYSWSCHPLTDKQLMNQFTDDSPLSLEQLIHKLAKFGPEDVVYAVENFDHDLEDWRFVGLYHHKEVR